MNEQINWKRIGVFLVIAITISNIFRFDIFGLKPDLEQLPTWLFILISVLLEGSGVIIGTVIVLPLLKKQRKTTISLFGTSTSKSLYMAIIPLVILTIIGVKNEFELNDHLYGFIAITGTLLYCIMEEYGWRGYLQEELQQLKTWQKNFTIGFIWYLWPLTFLTDANLMNHLFFLGMMIFGSWGIGQIAEATKSIITSACFHLAIQIMMFNALIKNGINLNEKLIILGVSVVLWLIIVKKWEKDSLQKNEVQ